MRGIGCKALLYAVLACLFVGAGELRGFVLCIGGAGHVAVEPSHGESPACQCGTCGQSEDDACAVGEETPCGECIDIPFSLCGVDRVRSQTLVVPGISCGDCASVSCERRTPPVVPAQAILGAHEIVPLDPTILRSVVLRL